MPRPETSTYSNVSHWQCTQDTSGGYCSFLHDWQRWRTSRRSAAASQWNRVTVSGSGRGRWSVDGSVSTRDTVPPPLTRHLVHGRRRPTIVVALITDATEVRSADARLPGCLCSRRYTQARNAANRPRPVSVPLSRRAAARIVARGPGTCVVVTNDAPQRRTHRRQHRVGEPEATFEATGRSPAVPGPQDPFRTLLFEPNEGAIMNEAWIIDACRTPRGIGKVGKGALADIHPQQLAATVLAAIAERNGLETADVDDVIWGTSMQAGTQAGDLGRMAALDAGFDTKVSGVTLDRFCGSGL